MSVLNKQMVQSLKIDKSTWRLTKFGDVAIQQKKNVDRENTYLTKYVKGEHMYSQDLHLREWGELIDEYLGPAFTRYFEEGDILYGSRRTYLRKVVIAPFQGITSNTTFVIKANEEKIDRRLLPFVMMTDEFTEHSVRNSKGSVNPYINWKDIANYEFLLPPKEEQKKLAELLWAMDDVIEKEKSLLENLKIAFATNLSQEIWKSDFPKKPLISFADPNLGKLIDGDWIESKDQSDDGIRLLQLADIGVGEFINKSSRFINEETFKRLRCFEVLPQDLLIARMPDPIGRACIVEDIGVRMITAVDCCILRIDNKKSDLNYLKYLLNANEFLHKANQLGSGTTRQRISRKNLEQIYVPHPTKQKQSEVSAKLMIFENLIKQNKLKLASSYALQKSLINQIF